MPFQRNLKFSGRDTILQTINHKLASDERDVRRVSVCGMGGVGKTQIAIEFAYGNAGRYHLIWWLRAEEPSRLSDDFVALGDYLRLEETASLNRPALIAAIRERLEQDDRWLLIFDNAEQPDDLIPFLPRVARGDVLITSRNHLWGELAIPVPVKAWERAGSVEFLDKALSYSCGMAGDGLAGDLGDLPLALAQAAAYINRTGIGIDEYRQLFRERREELWGKEARPLGYTDTVSTTWNLALHHIKESQPTSAALLVLFAQVGSGSLTIYRSLSQTFRPPFRDVLADPLKLAEAIAPLRQYSLVDVNGDLIIIHPLVRSVVLDYQGSELLGGSDDQAFASAPATPTPLPTDSSSDGNVQILTLKAARELLLAAPKSEVNEIRELFGAMYLPWCQGNTTDHEAVLQFIKRRFSTLVLMDQNRLSEVIEAATSAAATFQPVADQEDWQAGYERVRMMLRPVIAVLPREGECLARLASISQETVAAAVVTDAQTQGDYPTDPQRIYFKVIDYCTIGKLAWAELERAIKEASHIRNWTLKEAVRLGRRDFGEEFEERYLKLRRSPYNEELAEYERKEEEEKNEREERYRLEREERDRKLAEELKKYEVDVNAPTRAPSRRELELVRQRLETYLVEVSKIANLDPEERSSPREFDPWYELKEISVRAKRALKKHYPEICQEIVLTLHDAEHVVYAARQLRAILESVRDLVEMNLEEMELVAVDSKLEGSGGQLKQPSAEEMAQLQRLLSIARTLLGGLIFSLLLNSLLFGTLIWLLTK